MNERFLEVLSSVSSGPQCWQCEMIAIWGRFVTKIHIYTSSYEAGASFYWEEKHSLSRLDVV